ncbi:RecBCD enzyme subunit RecB [Vibrio aerogenes CECT 7868]|uniref:RecBCD enzyme subunit RecB n=1 Tax=Vibrio aerogenes CECT 7868 TaxID=1216006 RepID=A0A1M5WLE4_9VIBR|nr:exodeoxyribonuclease V subunit beta [Vibrio aerogenes]SHH88329.1 RecBCD enzyme subunit RecB [Vibrio aerogenes CECT 7868]
MPENNITHLNPLVFPLSGMRLIEASAGTGKTYTITGLYLRLLLGHGDKMSAHPQALSVGQILVVTFTEAATAELRGRIRERIHQARLAFTRGESEDPFLCSLLEETADHGRAAQVLLQAERDMDMAAIYTIHGFCQRMLVQNAFESGSRFQHEFITDESRLKVMAVADFWRCNFYGLSLTLAEQVRQLWPTPSHLLDDIGLYLSGSEPHLSVSFPVTDLESLHQQNLSRIETLKQQWRQSCHEFQGLIADSGVNKRSYTKKSLPAWIEQVSAWAAKETNSYDIPDKLERFSRQVLVEKTPKGEPPSHPVFDAIEDFLAQPVSLKAPLLAHAIKECRRILARTKQEKQWLSFDDLLAYLSVALKNDHQQLLAQRIRGLYPVAMIDEFQDTDPLQYHIFSQIYSGETDTGLLMIGDPKQAIYAFRGADIFTYMKARRQVSSHFTLATNWRSGYDMVMAVNQLFLSASRAFIYENDIPFIPVSAAPGAKERYWELENEQQPAMTWWWPDHQESYLMKQEYMQQMTGATVAQIQTILQASDAGRCHLISGQKKQPVQAGDIAVLVRTGHEGHMIKSALAKQGIASVYLSNRDSVFTGGVARDILRLLQAVLAPENERLLKAALASAFFMLEIFELDQLNTDELLWEQVIREFKAYRQIWSDKGIQPMLRTVLYQRQLAERWLRHSDGERMLTDYMHISELLQQAASETDSAHGLARWLTQSIEDSLQGLSHQDEYIQRLESEKNLVRIITIHKSKGLEFDLVFLPFAMNFREAAEAKYHDDEQDKVILDLFRSDLAMSQAEKERLAEDLRLLYVALTRAVYGCFIGVAAVAGRSKKGDSLAHLCAMGYLLQQGQPGDAALLKQGIEKVLGSSSGVLCAPPEPGETPLTLQTNDHDDLCVKTLNHVIERYWRMTSYSNLVKQSGHQTFLDAPLEPKGFDIDSAGESDEMLWTDEEKNIFTFPKGAAPGTFLHSLFEETEFTQPPDSEENIRIISALMETSSVDSAWLPTLLNMMHQVLTTPLDGKSLRLAEIDKRKRLAEMEFLLPVEVLQAAGLNRLIRQKDPLSAQAAMLGFAKVEGMLKGFIDLVFEYRGQYYILDWKSNHLGYHIEDYSQSRLQAAMIEHRYDLQYQLYTLALHRFLSARIPGYRYKKHFGGVYYIFLRGVAGRAEYGVFSHRPEEALILALDRLVAGQSETDNNPESGQMEMDL